MEQLDFLLIFTMDVKTYSCASWYLQFLFEEFKLGKHMGERWRATSECTGNIREVKPKMRGLTFCFFNSITFAFLLYIFRSRIFCLVLV